MARKPVAAFEEIIIRFQIGMIDPVANRVSRLFRDFKLNRLPRLLLHHHRSFGNARTMSNIPNSDPDEITTSQLAIDGKIEQSQATNLQGYLKPDANCPDFLQLEWWFLSCQFAHVPGASGFYMNQKIHFDSIAGWSESNYDFKLLQSGPPRSWGRWRLCAQLRYSTLAKQNT
jgi:hypothetical protein